mmetsp:Transcript_20820/g.48887  ORF Transcript_20820/g.48887 Transcript_20820/m.48887 type:complete len:385 (-) Transcript_20820:116-1270(-)
MNRRAMAGDAEGGDGGGTRSYFIRVREHGRAGEEDGRTTDAAPAGSSRHESDRVPPGGAAFGGVTSSNACHDALVSARDPSDGRVDRDAYVRIVNELSGDAFASFRYSEEGGGWGMYPATEFNHLPPLLRNEFYTQACGGPFIICDAFLYAGGADAGSDPSRDAQQEAYLSRLCLGVERAIDEAMQEPAVTGRPTAEPTASPTTEQPTASPAVVLTAAVPLSSQVVVSEAGDTPASGGFADGRGPPSGKVAYAATRNLTSFLIATLVTIMVCLAAFVTYTRRRVLRRMRRELEDDAAKMKGKKERRRRGRRRRTGEEEEENSGVIHDVESQTSQDNTAAGSAEFSEMEGHDCDSNCIREEEREVGVSGIGARTQEGATKVQPVV